MPFVRHADDRLAPGLSSGQGYRGYNPAHAHDDGKIIFPGLREPMFNKLFISLPSRCQP